MTHEMDVAVQANRIIHMTDGRIDEDTIVDDLRREEILSLNRESHDRMFRRIAMARPITPTVPHSPEIRSAC